MSDLLGHLKGPVTGFSSVNSGYSFSLFAFAVHVHDVTSGMLVL
jgi:hypothetical protein